MGFNSVVLVLNDRLSEIERDPEKFVEEMTYGIARAGCSGQEQVDFHPGQSTVVSCAHADQVQIIAVGGNCATLMGSFYNGGRHHAEESQVELLRALADKYGFHLRRKPQKKGSNAWANCRADRRRSTQERGNPGAASRFPGESAKGFGCDCR